jgi:hypothetical protein
MIWVHVVVKSVSNGIGRTDTLIQRPTSCETKNRWSPSSCMMLASASAACWPSAAAVGAPPLGAAVGGRSLSNPELETSMF